MMVSQEDKIRHNLESVLFLLRKTMKNSEVPLFISKLYILWAADTLKQITSKETIFPKEEFDTLYTFCHKEMDEIKDALDKCFEEFRKIEAAKEKK